MCSVQADAPLSLFGGVERFVAAFLGINQCRHWSAALALGTAPPMNFDGVAMIEGMFAIVSANWDRCMAMRVKAPSRHNWRWFDPKPGISPHNDSKEVTLERGAITAALAARRKDWSNQVPIAAGMIAGPGDRRRAIDLVHQNQMEPAAFDFVELKVGGDGTRSDSPIFAAVEILQYGLVWLLSRRHREDLGYAGRPLIEATNIRLSVLASAAYYRDLDLSWLANGLTTGLASLGGREHGVQLAFAFEAFPAWFSWPGAAADKVLPALDGRQTLWGSQPLASNR